VEGRLGGGLEGCDAMRYDVVRKPGAIVVMALETEVVQSDEVWDQVPTELGSIRRKKEEDGEHESLNQDSTRMLWR
jgi:hypothetical protein